MLKTGFIGAGKVGFTLGKYLRTHGIEVTGYYSRNTESAGEAAQFTQTKAYEDMGLLIENCDVLFLTVPDGCITSVFEEVKKYPISGKFICHCSGALSSKDAFPEIRESGAFAFSVHPLFAVSDKYHAYEELSDVFIASEGDEDRIHELKAMLNQAGLQVQQIRPEDKTRYHCAAAIASNLVVALISKSVDMLTECGFTPENALSALTPLMTGNIRHIAEDGVINSLTGPVERGDAETVKKHLECFGSEDDKELYTLLSRLLIPVAQARNPERSYRSVKEVIGFDRKEAEK